jgi:hypothetical protein
MIKKENIQIGVYCFSIVAILSLYNGLYAFSYFPITEGWFSEYASLIRQGKVPHKDFQLLLSPFYPLIIAAVQSFFGEGFLPLRILGIIVIAGIGLTLFFILRTIVGNPSAYFSSICATIYYQSGVAFIGYDFTQFLTLFLLLGGFACMSAFSQKMKDNQQNRIQSVFFFLTGLFFSLAFLTKHSNGGITTLVFFIFSFLIGYRTMRCKELVRNVVWSLAGFMLPIFGISLWMSSLGAFQKMLQDLFTNAAAAKGGLWVILTSWIYGVFGEHYFDVSLASALFITKILLATMILGIPFILLNIINNFRQVDQRDFNQKTYACIKSNSIPWVINDNYFALGLVAIFVFTIVNIYKVTYWGWGPVQSVYMAAYPILVQTSLNLCLYGLLILTPLLLARPSKNLINITLVLALGMGMLIGNGSSGGIGEISAFIGYALLIGYILKVALFGRIAALPVLVFGLAISSALMKDRYTRPYAWWGVEAYVERNEFCAKIDGLFKGICLNKDQAIKITDLAQAISKYTQKGDKIFVFPHMPVFYLISDREPFAGAVVSWYDFMNDNQALKLAESIEKNPPKIIIYALITESVVSAHEKLFRDGKLSGQRHIVEALSKLEKDGIRCRIVDVNKLNQLDIAVLGPC